MIEIILKIAAAVIIFTAPFITEASSAVFNIGPNQSYERLSDFKNWTNLSPGDTVRIFPGLYKEKIGIRGQGNVDNRIVIEGVPDAFGNYPTIDGDNAEESSQFKGFFNEWTNSLGVITLDRNRSTDPYSYKPKYITIKNLRIVHGHSDRYFKSSDGKVMNYAVGAAGLRIQKGENIIIENCEISDNQNGLFVLSKNSEEEVSRNIYVRKCNIFDNGTIGGDKHHNIYTQAANIIFEGNFLGSTKIGSNGSNLKDRSSGTIIRYNRIHSGARVLDLVDPEDSYDILLKEPNWGKTYVYGNIFINSKNDNKFSTNMIHYGGDTGVINIYRKGTMYFYYNTVFVNLASSDAYRFRLFQCSTNDETIEMHNNIITKSDVSTSKCYLMYQYGSLITAGPNFLHDECAYGETNYWYGKYSETVAQFRGKDVKFSDLSAYNFNLSEASEQIDKASNLPQYIQSIHPVVLQYKNNQNVETRSDSSDLGALNPNNISQGAGSINPPMHLRIAN